MRRELILAPILFLALAPAAFAQVPVDDSARNAAEKSIADCMTKARVYKQQTTQPSQGVQQSVATPGASTVPAAGTTDVTGSGSTAASGTVSGIDFSSLPTVSSNGAQTVSSLNLGAVAQAVGALTAVATAIQSNNSNTQAASAMMGNLALSQLAWNQNSGARINNGAMWNQLIMTATMTAQLFNQRSLQMTGGASAASSALTFDATKATFTGLAPSVDSNAITVSRPATN
jgi:hypothetical protein